MTPAHSPSRAIVAGVVTALVGFTSSFAVVLTGLGAVGASPAQAASGLLALSVTMGLACIVLAWRFGMPITVAWSTPGAALLAAGAAPSAGWPAAVGAFLLTGVLIVITGLWPAVGSLIARIPTAIAQAMLAGVLLPLCLAPVSGMVDNPWGVAPVLVTWLVCTRLVPRWAVPAAFVAATVVVVIALVRSGAHVDAATLLPRVVWVVPQFHLDAIIGITLPLFLVTMASQNVPGAAIMRSFGYTIPWRASMLTTGLGTVAGSFAGGHAINLAAISAALAASPEVDPDTRRRWPAGVATGVTYLGFAAASAAFATLVALAPAAVIPAVAGVALFSALAAAIHQALEDAADRIPAVVTFLVAASGVAIAGVSAAFWALLAGLLVRAVQRAGRRPRA